MVFVKTFVIFVLFVFLFTVPETTIDKPSGFTGASPIDHPGPGEKAQMAVDIPLLPLVAAAVHRP
jgi:hypothetical protein